VFYPARNNVTSLNSTTIDIGRSAATQGAFQIAALGVTLGNFLMILIMYLIFCVIFVL
jgi:hypothetical protein